MNGSNKLCSCFFWARMWQRHLSETHLPVFPGMSPVTHQPHLLNMDIGASRQVGNLLAGVRGGTPAANLQASWDAALAAYLGLKLTCPPRRRQCGRHAARTHCRRWWSGVTGVCVEQQRVCAQSSQRTYHGPVAGGPPRSPAAAVCGAASHERRGCPRQVGALRDRRCAGECRPARRPCRCSRALVAPSA